MHLELSEGHVGVVLFIVLVAVVINSSSSSLSRHALPFMEIFL